MGRLPRRKRQIGELALMRDQLPDVWRLDSTSQPPSYPLEPYRNHWKGCLTSIDNAHLRRDVTRLNVARLIEVVRQRSDGTVGAVEIAIEQECLDGLGDSTDPTSASAVLNFAMRLWLFIEPNLDDKSLTLRELVEQQLPKIAASSNLANVKRLSDDFSAKSLTRKGGFRLIWTSYLSEHLKFDSTTTHLMVFRHAAAIRQYAIRKQEAVDKPEPEEYQLFPDGFLEETERTLYLLFPSADIETSRRIRRISEKEGVDIEAAMQSFEYLQDYLQLDSYPFWQERLRHVQHVYDQSKPKRIKQWYYDRRDRVAWSTFWIAIVVFLLTLFFGAISTVTSIMQVYASFKAISRH